MTGAQMEAQQAPRIVYPFLLSQVFIAMCIGTFLGTGGLYYAQTYGVSAFVFGVSMGLGELLGMCTSHAALLQELQKRPDSAPKDALPSASINLLLAVMVAITIVMLLFSGMTHVAGAVLFQLSFQVLNDVWSELGSSKSAHEYVSVACRYLDLLLAQFGVPEVNKLLRDLVKRVTADKAYLSLYPQLQTVVGTVLRAASKTRATAFADRYRRKYGLVDFASGEADFKGHGMLGNLMTTPTAAREKDSWRAFWRSCGVSCGPHWTGEEVS